MSNVFSMLGNVSKANILSAIDQLREAVDQGWVQPTHIDLEPTRFSVEFKGTGKSGPSAGAARVVAQAATVVPQAPVHTPAPAPVPDKQGFIMPTVAKKKLNDREAETHRKGVDYVCPCGFKTGSIRGFKKHFNKCQNRS